MRATDESKKLFEGYYKNRGYKSMRQVASAAGLNYANLTRVMNGVQSEGGILVRLAKFFGVSYRDFARSCGFCGADGEAVLDELDNDFQAQRGNATVVGNNNNVNNNVHNIVSEAMGGGVTAEGIDDRILGQFAGTADGRKMINRFMKLQAELEALRKESEIKDRHIEQLEKDKAFYQSLLQKG